MSKLPWFAQYPSDFIAGCQGLEGVQIGVYSMLLNLLYARRANLRCRTIDDQQKLARTCGVTTRAFNRIVAELATMPNKITRDKNGDLSNPRFEKWLGGKGEDQPEEKTAKKEPTSSNNNGLSANVPPKPQNAQKEQTGAEKSQKNPSKIPEKPTDKIQKKSPTFCKNNDLQPNVPPLPHARARPRNHIEDNRVQRGGSGGGPEAPPEHTQDQSSFAQWYRACKRTIPKGWKSELAFKRWQHLPPHPVAVWIDAWDCYVAHNRQQSENARWHQKTSYPENWWHTGQYADFLAEAIAKIEGHQESAIKRANAIQRFAPHGPAIIAKIGAPKFDAWLLDAEFVITAPAQAELRVPKPFHRKWLRENAEIVRAIEVVTNTSITITGPPQPQQERA